MLTHLGHRVVSCSANGRELVDECLPQLPGLVITDIKMPEMTTGCISVNENS